MVAAGCRIADAERDMGYDLSILEAAGVPDAKARYRLTTRAMREIVEVLMSHGVAHDEPPPSWPTGEADREALRAADTLAGATIAAYKLMSNDGWRMSPGECRAVAEGLRGALAGVRVPAAAVPLIDEDGLEIEPEEPGEPEPIPERLRPVVQGFIAFNERSALHGGYRVR